MYHKAHCIVLAVSVRVLRDEGAQQIGHLVKSGGLFQPQLIHPVLAHPQEILPVA